MTRCFDPSNRGIPSLKHQLRAQRALDRINGTGHRSDATTNSPASKAGASTGTAGAGELANARPRPDMLSKIHASTDAGWLKAVMGSQDYQVSVRSAAQRRLGVLFGKKKAK